MNIFQYGYYLPAKNVLGMDQELAVECKSFYHDMLGLNPEHSEHFDGVSVFESNGKMIFRVILQNFFADFYDVKTYDYERAV
jgi:hypothetical protein